MASAADELMDGIAEAYDELRREMFSSEGVASRCFLLRKIEDTNEYETLLELTTGWYTSYEAFRAQTLLKVARRDEAFKEAFTQLTDFAIDRAIYSVEQRDKDTPKQNQFYYSIFGSLETTNLFTIP